VGGDLFGQSRVNLGVQVTSSWLAQVRYALAAESEDPPVLRPGRNRQCQSSAIRRWNVRLATQDERRQRCDHLGVQIVAASLEAGVRPDSYHQVQIPGPSAGSTSPALPGDSDSAAFGHTGRDLDFQAARLAVGLLELQHARCAMIGFFQRDLDGVLQVGTGPRPRRSPTTRPAVATTSEEGAEEVRKRLFIAEQVLHVFG
jgi:hypothetical protein